MTLATIGCDKCGSTDFRIQEWWAPDYMWLHVMENSDGVLCAPCFDFLAKKKGWFLRWCPEIFPGSKSPVEEPEEISPSYDDFFRSFGRSLVSRLVKAEEMIEILSKERDSALSGRNT